MSCFESTLGKSFLTLLAGILIAEVTLASPGAVTLNKPNLIGMTGFDEKSSEFSQACGLLQKVTDEWSMSTQAQPKCWTRDFLNTSTNDSTSGYGTIIQFNKNPKINGYTLTIKNLNSIDPNEPSILSWNIKAGDQALPALRSLMVRYSVFDQSRTEIKKSLLSQALEESVNDDSFAAKYEAFNQDPKNARYMAAGLEISVMLGGAIYGYYSVPANKNPNTRDWDIKTMPEAIHKKLETGDMIRYDDNHYHTNTGHYWAGTSYYSAARTSGIGRLNSLLITFAASSFWETFGEYREVLSINDEINTTFGGFVMGETLFQISKIFRKSKSNSFLDRFLKNTFGSPEKFSAYVENSTTGQKRAFTDLDLTPEEQDFWSKLDLSVGMEKLDNHSLARIFGVSGIVINIPDYTSPGFVSGQWLTKDTVDTELNWEMGVGKDYSELVRLYSKITLAAFYRKQMTLDEQERLEGYQFYIGPASALEINNTAVGGDPRAPGNDFRAIAHVIGNTINLTAYKNGVVMNTVIDVFGDFAMIHSPSFDEAAQSQNMNIGYTQSNCGNIQSVLCHEGYYYGLGETIRARSSVQVGLVELGASGEINHEKMINSRSRFLETSEDMAGEDRASIVRGWVAYSFSKKLKLEIGVENTVRLSSISGAGISPTSTNNSNVMKYGKLVYKFD